MKASLFLLSLAGLAAAPATAQPSSVFVFGDSLVDSGNAQAARLAAGGEDPAPAALGYFNGRFSNGPNFADYASEIYYGPGVYTQASLLGGTNFSVGGAQAAEVAGDTSPSFLEQIASFTASGRTIDASSLVIVTLGGNDVRREIARLAANPTYVPSFTDTIAAMTTGLTSLFASGARNIVVTGLPNVGGIPAVTQFYNPALEAAGLALSTGLNNGFRTLTNGFDLSTGANFVFFDFLAFQNQLYTNPTAYGLPANLNTRDACLGTPAAPTCAGYVYFDPVHPTTAIHRAVGLQLVLAAGVPEPATWAMMIVGFGAVGVAMRRRKRLAVA